jgi:glucokinase
MTRAVFVNGVPASGKSSIAHAVGARLELPVLSLDSVKEALFDELGDADGDREFGRALGRASMQAIWSVVADFPPTSAVVIEAWFRLPPHDAVMDGIRRAGIEQWAEIWCHASVDVLVARYASRTRHPGHPPASYATELAQLAAMAKPMSIERCLSVDTSDFASVDLDGVAGWAGLQLGLSQARH